MRADDRALANLMRNFVSSEVAPSTTVSLPEHAPGLCSEKTETFCEKHPVDLSLPYPNVSPKRSPPGLTLSLGLRCILLLISIFNVAFILTRPASVQQTASFDTQTSEDICSQYEPITPSAHADLLKDLETNFETRDFQLKAYESLGGAIRIPTEVYDDLKPPGEDSRWEVFSQLHAYLLSRFPMVHTTLKKTIVNKYALVYHWQGTDESLKPILLAAHQDVVPVEPETVKQWVNPPYSGLYDGEWIWGRGSVDDKPGLIGSLTAVESLLEKGFKPTRSVVLAYGIDEERGGIFGATAIRDYLLDAYGENAFSMIVDEGGHQETLGDVIFATPAVAEKGKFDMRVEVLTPGGHSSVPPKHTSIGILAQLIITIEAHPRTPSLPRTAVYYNTLQCQAAHDPTFPSSLRDLLVKSRKDDSALKQLEDELLKNEETAKLYRAVQSTTQAVDIIGGGVKVNALPEKAWALVNHRIASHSSVAELQASVIDTLTPVAERFNLSVLAFGNKNENGEDDQSAYGKLVLSDAFGTALEPAPVTPTSGPESGPWNLLSGTIRSVVGSSQRSVNANNSVIGERKIVVAPSISTGNTDTKHYWKLTKNIFRYGHLDWADSYGGAHTVNEAIRARGFIEVIRFFTFLVLNADETNLFE